MILYSRVKLIFARIALHLASCWKWGFLKLEYSPFLHRPSCTLFPLPKTFCITIVFDFSLDDCYTEEKLETMVPLQSMWKCSMPFYNIFYEKPCLIFYIFFSLLCADHKHLPHTRTAVADFFFLLKPMHAKAVWSKIWPLCITFFSFPLAVLRRRYCKQVYISEYILSSKLQNVLLHGFELVYSMPL